MRSSWFPGKSQYVLRDARGKENLNIHEVVHADTPKLGELLSTLLQELCDRVTLLTLNVMRVRIVMFRILRDNAP